MSSNARISRTADGFNSYINTTNTYLLEGTPTNYSRLSILDTEMTQWTAFTTEWNTVYPKYYDKKNSRTTAIVDQINDIIDRTVTYDQENHLLDRIAASPNVTLTDLETFNIKSGPLQKTTRTVPTTPITESVVAILQPIGGGSVNIKCRSTTASRAGIYGDADSVHFAYGIGTAAPESMDGLTRDISTRASFTLALGTSSSGKNLYIYFQWYNTKHTELAGPWSSLLTTLIL